MNSEELLPCGGATAVARISAEIQERWHGQPRVGLILGTGLGNLASLIVVEAEIPYIQLPEFPKSTAISHRGRLVCGRLAGQPIIALDGRCHFYEGYSAEQITLPIHVLRQLGAETLVVSNASGGLNPQFQSGDILAIVDHINWMGARTAELGGGLPPIASRRGLASLYNVELVDRALAIARLRGFACHRGVYVGVLGPNYETRAEYRLLRRIGGDAVGMSTVPEALAAGACGMRVLALSVITNVARPDVPLQVDAQQVVDLAACAEPRIRDIVLGVLEDLASPREA